MAVLTDSELRAALRVSRQTLWRLRKAAAPLPFFRVGSQYRYRSEDVEAWLVQTRFRDPQLILPLAESTAARRRPRAPGAAARRKGR